MINPMRQRAIDGLKVGDAITFSRSFAQEETHQFGDLTRDYNPVHYDIRWANAKGLDGLICHGLLVGSMICEIGGQIGWLASGMNFKFIRPVMIGETITCKATLVEIEPNGRARAEAEFTNDNGKLVCHCILTGRIPLASERRLLKTIAREHEQMPNLP